MKEIKESKIALNTNKVNKEKKSNSFEIDNKISQENEIIKSNSKKITNNYLTKENLEQLVKTESIKNLDKNFLNIIDMSVLSKLSDNFFK